MDAIQDIFGPAAYHSMTRLSHGREGLLVDPGAYDNLQGEHWLQRQVLRAQRAGVPDPVTYKNLIRPLGVEGVGNGTQTATQEATVTGVIQMPDGQTLPTKYTAPVIPDSEIPALLGLKSLKEKRAILDLVNNRLYLCGRGEPKFVLPEDSVCLQLEPAASGHLLLPFSDFGPMGQLLPAHPPANAKTNTKKLKPTNLAFTSSIDAEA